MSIDSGKNTEQAPDKHLPPLTRELQKASALIPTEDTRYASEDNDEIASLFPHTYASPYLKFVHKDVQPTSPLRVGVMFSGGPAPGGHNVVLGLLHGLKHLHPESQLFGFLDSGKGLINGEHIEITDEFMLDFTNSGGFHCIGTGRTKFLEGENKQKCLETVKQLQLDGLVIIGGDGSNTATALFAEYFASQNIPVSVVGIPKTIDGDLQHLFLDITFGFDSATKFYSSIISNISRDALSCKAHYHFIKLMGRSASHVALECALQTHPNITLIGEEIAAEHTSLKSMIDQICSIIADRASMGKYHGIVLIPEGIIEFIPEVNDLVREIEQIPEGQDKLTSLSQSSRDLLSSFPDSIVQQLLYDRDGSGNVYVSKIHVEKLLIYLVKNHLEQHYKNVPFNAVSHFLGYEGRCGTPTRFDNIYSYNLGYGASVLVHNRCNGYLTALEGLMNIVEKWRLRAIPIVKMFTTKKKHDGTLHPLIKKSLMDIDSPAFKKFKLYRKVWALEDSYRFVGPQQMYVSSEEYSDNFPPLILFLNHHNEWENRCSLCLEIPDQTY